MREYKVVLRTTVRKRLDAIARHIKADSTEEHAMRYVEELRHDMAELSYLADSLPKSKYDMPKRFHRDAKTWVSGNRKWTFIFHIDGEYVIVDKILPSCMITY